MPDLSGLLGLEQQMVPERHLPITGSVSRLEETTRDGGVGGLHQRRDVKKL